MSKESTARVLEDEQPYLGRYFQRYVTDEQRRKKWKKRHGNKIFLFTPEIKVSEKATQKLTQIVNLYDYTYDDFEFNGRRIIEHCKKYYGDTSTWMYTIGQFISFRVYPEQEVPFELSLYQFFINFALLAVPILCHADMRKWEPYNEPTITPDRWIAKMNQHIRMVRRLGNNRKIGEAIELAKFLTKLFLEEVGDRIGLTINNNEFIELMKRSEEARKSITCSFDIPKNITPSELETLTTKRTKDLLKFMEKQTDLSLSVYARNNLLNPTQFRECAVHMTHKPNLRGNTIPYTYPTNIMMGINDPRAHVVDASGGRKAEIIKLNVSEAGMLERSLMMLMDPVRYVDRNYECCSQHFRTRTINTIADLSKVEGRVICLNPHEPVEKQRYWTIDTTDVDLVGKTVFMKTPITCTHPRRKEGYICSACYGRLMANINNDVHIGKMAAADSADEIEQKLLSAKHALNTNTDRVEFGDDFNLYFEMGNGCITFNEYVVEQSGIHNSIVNHLCLEFYPNMMKKHLDGESRNFDRSFDEIVIFNDKDGTRMTIQEANGAPLYLSPEFNSKFFLPKLRYVEKDEPIRVPFMDILEDGTPGAVLFEFTYKNNELASPLLKLESIMFNCETIQNFDDYNTCLNTLIPLFAKGGIHIPDYQIELLVSQLIWTLNGKRVDWNQVHPEYTFNSISKSIKMFDSAITSILYRESGAQIAGANGTYDKRGTSSYDPFIMGAPSIWS